MKTSRQQIKAILGAAITTLSASLVMGQIVQVGSATPNPNDTITPQRERALKLFQGLTGTRVSIDDARLVQMEALIKAGNQRAAAAIATQDPLFIDIQIRDVAKKMSTRDESVRAPLSDFVATFMGVVRDSDTTSAKELLTGNFYYKASDAASTSNQIRNNELNDIVKSNNHYADIVAKNLSANAILVRQSPLRLRVSMNDVESLVDHPDPAGLITSRAFFEAHAVAGTNRRLVEYSMREFMCVGMQEWADSSNSDGRVGMDVTRRPANDPMMYETTCKSCHSGMDAFRGAFAFANFDNNVAQISTTVQGKMNRNTTEAPTGWRTVNNSFEVTSQGSKNIDQLGWRSASSGVGMAGFGRTLAESRGFSRCLVRRAFKAVCRRAPLATEESVVRSLADQFETDGYHMKRMYQSVAIQPQCIQ